MQVTLTRYTNEPVAAIEEAASNSYDATIKNPGKIMNQCFDAGHHSVLEFATFTFHIEGISRACLAQLSRHRIASLVVRSQRYTKEKNIDWIVPPALWENFAALRVYDDIQEKIETAYNELLSMGIKSEDARYVLSNATPTTLEFSMNLRSLINFCNLRLCCYDEETEFLTKDGWKYGRDLSETDKFYSINTEDMSCNYVNPSNYYKYKYNGNMVRVNGQSVDLLITPNHKNLVSYSYDNKKWELSRADEFDNHKKILMKKNCVPIVGKVVNEYVLPAYDINYKNQYTTTIRTKEARSINIHDFMRVLGFYISDGCCANAGRHFTISFAKESIDVINKYAQILERITGHKAQVYDSKKGCYILKIHDRQLYDVLHPLGSAKSKKIPDWVWEYDYTILHSLYEGFFDGDFNSNGTIYTTTSKALADDMQRLALHLGWSATITTVDRIGEVSSGISPKTGVAYKITTKNIYYQVSYNRSKNEPILKASNRSAFSFQQYRGYVYCVDLPIQHTLYVRRNGKSVWSGNSHAQWEIRILAGLMRDEVVKVMPDAKRFLVPQCERNTEYPFCTEAKSCGRYSKLSEVYRKESKE